MSESSATVRVALIGCSGLLGQIIDETVRSQDDLAVVARLGSAEAGASLTDVDADIVLWQDADEDRVRDWLSGVAHGPRVLATLRDGRHAALWELVPHRTELGDPSPAMLLQSIREHGGRP